MSRVQLALDVADLDVAIDFYSKLCATAVEDQTECCASRPELAVTPTGGSACC